MRGRRIKNLPIWVDDKLKELCERIAPKKRVIVLLVMFCLFASSSIFIFTSAIYSIGKEQGRQIEVDHVKVLNLQRIDSLKHFNNNDYDRD
ncbi:MAG: TraL conjugative transposon family protein [Bacteroidales bacterium]